jgi:hypothetical protein
MRTKTFPVSGDVADPVGIDANSEPVKLAVFNATPLIV